MGQNVSTTSRFNDLLESLLIRIPLDAIVRYPPRHNRNAYKEITSAELRVPLDSKLLDKYTLDDLDQILDKYFVLYISDRSFLSRNDIKDRMITGGTRTTHYILEIRLRRNDYYDSIRKLYQIYAATYEDADIMVNALLGLFAGTQILTDYKSFEMANVFNINTIERPLAIDPEIFCTFLRKTGPDTCELNFYNFKFNAEQGAILASSAIQPNVELNLFEFEFEDNGIAFSQGLARNNGPAILGMSSCESIFLESTTTFFINVCNAIAKYNNTQLKGFLCFFNANKEALSSLCDMLRSNNGLTRLEFSSETISDKSLLFQSLHKHPTLRELYVQDYSDDLGGTLSRKEKVQRTIPVVELLKNNLVISRIDICNRTTYYGDYYDKNLIRTEVNPRLKINQKRMRVLEINTALEEKARVRLIGMFLLDARSNLSLIWLVVRENPILIIKNFQNFNETIVAGPAFKKLRTRLIRIS